MSTEPSDSQEPEFVLTPDELQAVEGLVQYLENQPTENLLASFPHSAAATLSFSDIVDLQRSAALAFSEITDKEVVPIGRDILDPLLFLLSSSDNDVQRAASAALGNLAVDVENKLLIVKLGGLEPLIRLLQSSNIEVQCNAVGCVTNLSTHDENKTRIARSGILAPLIHLAHSEDMRVQRNATGVILNMTHSHETRQHLISAGAVPVLVSVLNTPDVDAQYHCITALSNIAVDSAHRRELMTEPELVQNLVVLIDSPELRIQRQVALALRNLASDEKYQIEIVEAGALTPLLRLIQTGDPGLVLPAVACILNLSIYSPNETPIIDKGLLNTLVALLSFDGSEEIQCHAISTLRNLAASSDKSKQLIVQAGAVQKIKDLVMHVSSRIQAEMKACITILALNEGLKPQLIGIEICEVLVLLTNSPNNEVQGNSGATLANLISRGLITDSALDNATNF